MSITDLYCLTVIVNVIIIFALNETKVKILKSFTIKFPSNPTT